MDIRKVESELPEDKLVESIVFNLVSTKSAFNEMENIYMNKYYIDKTIRLPFLALHGDYPLYYIGAMTIFRFATVKFLPLRPTEIFFHFAMILTLSDYSKCHLIKELCPDKYESFQRFATNY